MIMIKIDDYWGMSLRQVLQTIDSYLEKTVAEQERLCDIYYEKTKKGFRINTLHDGFDFRGAFRYKTRIDIDIIEKDTLKVTIKMEKDGSTASKSDTIDITSNNPNVLIDELDSVIFNMSKDLLGEL